MADMTLWGAVKVTMNDMIKDKPSMRINQSINQSINRTDMAMIG